MRGRSWALGWYLAIVYVAAAAVLVAGFLTAGGRWPPGWSAVAAVATFALLSYAGERATLPMSGSFGLSLTTPMDVAAILLFPPPVPALIVAAVGTIAQATRREVPLHKRAFNVAHPTLVVGLCGFLWPLLASPAGQHLPALALLIGLYHALDVGVLLGVLSIDARRAPWAVWRDVYRPTVLSELAAGALGVLAAIAWRADPTLLALLALPAWALRSAFRARAQAETAYRAAEAAHRTAEEAVGVRDAFLTAGSHDLRTPLTVLMGRLGLLSMRLETGETLERGWLEAQTASMEGAARRMAATIDEMTDAAHLQMGQRLTLRAEPLDVSALVREVAAMTAEATQAPDGAVVVDAPAGVVVMGDRRRLERVTQNIVGNALKYSPTGAPVLIAVRRDGAEVTIAVRDEGIGIPAEELPRIFARFYRASTARGVAGTGIGLAAARAIVEQHGGELRVESAVGQGTTVTIVLPVGTDNAPLPVPTASHGRREPLPHAASDAHDQRWEWRKSG